MTNAPYLWDKSEPPDPFVVKLEHILAERRARILEAGRARPRRPSVLAWIGSLAMAAAATVTLCVCLGGDGCDARRGAPPVAVETRVPTSSECEDVALEPVETDGEANRDELEHAPVEPVSDSAPVVSAAAIDSK